MVWNMYIFRDKKLATQLHEDVVTERTQMFYLLGVILYYSFFITISVGHAINAGSPSPTLYARLIDVVFIFSQTFIIFYTSKINRTGDGKHFLSRYICLSFPITIKVTFLMLLLGILAAFGDNTDIVLDDSTDFDPSKMLTGPYALSGACLAYLYMVWRYIAGFKIASGLKKVSQ
ncbi:MAG: hypothetical protein R3D66_04165 [Alphaproteobacteria bacterium]